MQGDRGLDAPLACAVIARSLRTILRPPRAETVLPLACVEGRKAVQGAAGLLDPEGTFGLLRAAASIPVPGSDDLADLAARYGRLFGHTLRGQVCPYETEYGAGPPFRQEHELADVAGYFLAFGLRPPDAGDARLDHIACELEFLEFLCLKEAWALGHEDEAMAEVTRDAARRFLRDHLGRFGVAFGESLAQAEDGGSGLYGAAGRLCAAFVRACCLRLDVPAGPAYLTLRPAGDDGVPMACGEACDPPGEAGDDLLGIAPPGARR